MKTEELLTSIRLNRRMYQLQKLQIHKYGSKTEPKTTKSIYMDKMGLYFPSTSPSTSNTFKNSRKSSSKLQKRHNKNSKNDTIRPSKCQPIIHYCLPFSTKRLPFRISLFQRRIRPLSFTTSPAINSPDWCDLASLSASLYPAYN